MTQSKTDKSPNQNLSALTAKIDAFPILPTVVARVMQITGNPDSSANDLMRVISQDQSLTATILKMANSPFFGLARKVSSLQHALVVLGFKEIQNVVLTKAVFNSFKSLKKNDKFDIRKFWEHSFLCGLAAKIMASELKEDSNEFFVAGLIHDIGKLVIYMALPLEFFKIIEVSQPLRFRTFEAEETILGTTHDVVGMNLLKRWMFPENLLMAVGFHHRPHEAKRQQLFPEVVHVTDLLAYLADQGDEEARIISLKAELFTPGAISLFRSHGLKWNESTFERFQQELAKQKEEESDILSLLLS